MQSIMNCVLCAIVGSIAAHVWPEYAYAIGWASCSIYCLVQTYLNNQSKPKLISFD